MAIRKRYKRKMPVVTHMRVYKKDRDYLRKKFPRLTDAQIIEFLRKKC